VTGLVDGLRLIDHHCHGIVQHELDRTAFEKLLCESDAPGPWHGSLFDTQVGLAVRRLCAPLLDLPAHTPAETYLERRAELGAAEVAARLLGACGIEQFFVDTGYLPIALTSPAELARLGGGIGREIVRLEQVAEQIAPSQSAAGFANAFREALHQRVSGGAVGVKSVAAYRVGLDIDPARPTDAEVVAAASQFLAGLGSAGPRLADSTLIRFLIWTGIDVGLPVQFHVGYGDASIDLAQADPLLLTPLLRATTHTGVPIMLLHNYPFHRQAGYLAQVFDHVFVDVGLATQNVGVGVAMVLRELLELAPFGSVLFSTDAFGLPELFSVSTVLFRRALAQLLDEGIAEESWSARDAERFGLMIAADNARRAYWLAAD
jgi:predicted TIM-barrel fold metal-dependent hydrolase